MLFMKIFSALGLFALMLILPTALFAGHSININTADKAALITLTGIGEVKAQAIIDYRTTNGPYATIEDIQNVSGIGPATYNSIKDHITVQGGNSAAPSPSPSSPPPSPGQASPPPTPTASSESGFTVDGGSDRTVIAGADVQFTARAYNRSKEVVENAGFVWNFGDGSTAQGTAIVHRFEHPGRYAVVVTGTKDNAFGSDRFTVTAESAQLSVRVLPDGSIEIENLGARDIDLSHWTIQSSGKRFPLPDNSLVLAREVMRISPNTLHFYPGSSTELDYPNGSLAFRAGDTTQSPPTPIPSAPAASSAGAQADSPRQVQFRSEPEALDVPEEESGSGDEIAVSTSSQAASAGEVAPDSWMWWWLSAFGLAAVAAGAIVAARRLGRREWDIVEEKTD